MSCSLVDTHAYHFSMDSKDRNNNYETLVLISELYGFWPQKTISWSNFRVAFSCTTSSKDLCHSVTKHCENKEGISCWSNYSQYVGTFLYFSFAIRGSSVGIVTRPRTSRLMNLSSIPVREKIILSSPRTSRPALVPNWRLFPQGKTDEAWSLWLISIYRRG